MSESIWSRFGLFIALTVSAQAPRATITPSNPVAMSFIPRPVLPGQQLRAGDVILTRNGGLFAFLIRWGTRTGRNGINHAGVVAADQTEPGAPVETIEAVASGVVLSVRSNLTGYVFRLTDDPAVAQEVVAAARSFLGTPYDWVGIARFAVICLRGRWWGKPFAALLATVLPDEDDGMRVFCSDHVSQALTKVWGDLGLGPTYAVAPIDLLRYFIGYGSHIPGQQL